MFGNQPKINVKPTSADRNLIRLGWALIIFHFVLILLIYGNLPETVPTHFNLKGEADGYGNKNDIWALPILSSVLYYGLWLLTTRLRPWNFNYPLKVTEKNAPLLYALSIRMLVWLNLGTALLFLTISLHSIIIAKGILTMDLGWLLMTLATALTLYPFFIIYKMFNINKA